MKTHKDVKTNIHMLPCPFCGSLDVKLKYKRVCFGHGDYYNEYYVCCEICNARGPSANDFCKDVRNHDVLVQDAYYLWCNRNQQEIKK